MLLHIKISQIASLYLRPYARKNLIHDVKHDDAMSIFSFSKEPFKSLIYSRQARWQFHPYSTSADTLFVLNFFRKLISHLINDKLIKSVAQLEHSPFYRIKSLKLSVKLYCYMLSLF